MSDEWIVVGLGESLWDILPSGPRLGGAPLNVAVHSRELLDNCPGRFVLATRVGSDSLGKDILDAVAARGLDTDFVQQDATHPTGTVAVELTSTGPKYTFADDVAWDRLEFTPSWSDLAKNCSAVCYGTLAQRSRPSRETILTFLDAAKHAVRMFDVNLRPPYYDPELLEQSCRRASMVKLNEHELPVLAEALGLPAGAPVFQLAQLRARYELDLVIYTRGARGTMLVLPNKVISPPAVAYPITENADDVGAGDACTAAVLVGWLLKLPPARIAELANQMGAFVASQSGATPRLPDEIKRLVNENQP
jgi:fructokinase